MTYSVRKIDTKFMQENSFFKKITYTEGIYPEFNISLIQNPSRFYAVPLLGIIFKMLAIIPVALFMLVIAIGWILVVFLVNPFIVLATGKYWKTAYDISLALMRLSVKTSAYLYGLTDKYPGFNFNMPENMTLNLPYPEKSNRLYAIPVLGFLIRIVFLIPYLIFEQIIAQAVTIGVFLLAWAVVLFKGRYPEGIFELARDQIRITGSSYAYLIGLSDRYPSFYISMAHDKIKIILIALSIVLSGFNYVNGDSKSTYQLDNNTQYNNNLEKGKYPSDLDLKTE